MLDGTCTRRRTLCASAGVLALGAVLAVSLPLGAQKAENQQPPGGPDRLKSGDPTNTDEPRPTAGGKPLPDRADVAKKQKKYLEERYDLSGKTDPQVNMSGGRKPVPVGPTARLPEGLTWEELAKLSPEEI